MTGPSASGPIARPVSRNWFDREWLIGHLIALVAIVVYVAITTGAIILLFWVERVYGTVAFFGAHPVAFLLLGVAVKACVKTAKMLDAAVLG